MVKILFKQSQKEVSVSLDTLEKKAIEFLEHYATYSLVGEDFIHLVGTGSGKEQLQNLYRATGFGDNGEAFFTALLKQLEEINFAPKTLGGIDIPYLFLVSLLEVILPGEGYTSIKTVEQLKQVTNLEIPKGDEAALKEVIDTYPVRLSDHTIRQMMLSKDVAYQYLPFTDELDTVGHTNTWIGQFHQGLLEQMYQNRVIFLLHMGCPVYCRFCFRKHKESRNESNPCVEDVNKAIEHVKNSPTIKEIVVTGGDPFMSRTNMAATIDGLMDIDHVQSLRLATRSIAYYPDMFLKKDGEYLKYFLQKNLELQLHNKRLEVATHFIHPDEVSPQCLEIITTMVNAGIAVYIQTPFLKDCNDQGPELKKLFGLLRAAGAELHYIYIPCSPIHGNSVYWSTLAEGIDIAEYLRAHLSDRSVPKICTATPIGKMEWYTSGWAVEPVEDKENFIWIRTPYTPEYFKSFAPLAEKLPNIRVNPEGTLDIQFMAKIGKEEYFLGSRPLKIKQTPVPAERPASLQFPAIQPLLRGKSIVNATPANLRRLHETRVEIETGSDEQVFEYIQHHKLISDVIIHSETDTIDELYQVEKIVRKLRTIEHVTSVRLRSLKFNYEPDCYTAAVINKLGELNKLTITNPLRLEIETWFISADELAPAHEQLTRKLNNKGITVYSNTPLLGTINDFPDEIARLTFGYRKAGIEFHHLYVAGLPVQQQWNKEKPVDMYDVIDIASKIRREGSGREGPRYIIQTPVGEVYYGLTSSFFLDGGQMMIKLDSYKLDYYQDMDPDFVLPKQIKVDPDGKLIMPTVGLTGVEDFRM